jgi:hypothetical protein
MADVIGGYSDNTSNGKLIWGDNVGCNGALTDFFYYGTGIKPMLQLLAGAGNNIETAANSTSSQYVGDNSAYYFFTGSNVLSSVTNASANLSCVTATLAQAGTTWQPFLNAQRSQKVVSILPSANSNAASQVGLYFTAAELGGKAPGTLVMAKTTASTIAGANASNTVAAPTTFTAFGSGYLFTATFTGMANFFLTDNFVVLPVSLVSFQGKIDNGAGFLTWRTSSEQNTRDFDVQKSADGISYQTIGTVSAAGNSSSQKDYSFRDAKLNGLNYYRLKLNDRDGRSKMSTVVLLQYGEAAQTLSVATNPFSHYIDLRLAKVAHKVNLQLLSATGSLLAEKSFAEPSGLLHWELNKTLGAGSYLLRSVVDGNVFTNKLIKQ